MVETEQSPDNGAEQNEPKPEPKKQKRKFNRKTPVDPDGGVTMQLMFPRPIHEELKRISIRSNVPMRRVMIEAFLDIVQPPNKAEKLRSLLGPMQHQAAIAAARRNSERNAYQRCDQCMKTHPNMPGFGPWHEEKCPMWRIRATVMVEGEKEG